MPLQEEFVSVDVEAGVELGVGVDVIFGADGVCVRLDVEGVTGVITGVDVEVIVAVGVGEGVGVDVMVGVFIRKISRPLEPTAYA